MKFGNGENGSPPILGIGQHADEMSIYNYFNETEKGSFLGGIHSSSLQVINSTEPEIVVFAPVFILQLVQNLLCSKTGKLLHQTISRSVFPFFLFPQGCLVIATGDF